MGPARQVTALGMDYGTTTSLAAVAVAGAPPSVVPVLQRPDGPVMDRLPGYLYFPTRGRVIVGEMARRQYPLKPHKVVRSVKRDMQGSWTVGQSTYGAADLVRFTLRELAFAARELAEGPLRSMVLTVPSTFGQSQRRTLIDAARQADRWIDEVTLLDEPLAAFLAYLHEARDGRCAPPPPSARVMVFDMGGGTTDISVLEVLGDGRRSFSARVLGVSSDTRLGGDDFDRALAGHLASMWMDGTAIDSGLLTDSERRFAGGKLLVAAEEAKIELCGSSRSVRVAVDGLPATPRLDVTLEHGTHLAVVDSLLMRVRETVRQGLDVSGLAAGDVDVTVLAGGMARCDAVVAQVTAMLGRPPVVLSDPVTAVVRGACLHHQSILGEAPPVLVEPLRPVLTQALGLKLARGGFMTLLAAGTELPATRTVTGCLLTPHTGSSVLRLPLYGSAEGEGAPRRILATLTLCSKEELPGGQPVGLTVEADMNKLITVRAFLQDGSGPARTLDVRGL